MSKLYPPPVQQSFEAAVNAARVARKTHFPRWQRVGLALAMGAGLVLLALSTARPAAADILFMLGFSMVALDAALLAWILVRLPSLPERVVHAQSLARSRSDVHENT